MADLTDVVLEAVNKKGGVETLELAAQLSVDHQKIVGAVKSLQSLGDVSYTARYGVFSFMCSHVVSDEITFLQQQRRESHQSQYTE